MSTTGIDLLANNFAPPQFVSSYYWLFGPISASTLAADLFFNFVPTVSLMTGHRSAVRRYNCSIIYLLTDLFNLPPAFGLEGDGPSRFEGRHPKRKYIVGWLALMVMSANDLRAVRIMSMNRSVISLTVLESVFRGSMGRRMTSIMFFIIAIITLFIMIPGVLVPSAVMVGRFMIPAVSVLFSADVFIPDLFMMPVFSAIRPGSTGK